MGSARHAIRQRNSAADVIKAFAKAPGRAGSLLTVGKFHPYRGVARQEHQPEERTVIRWHACPTTAISRPLFGMPSEPVRVLDGEAKQYRNPGRWRR
jgi:hypothetical protein